MPFDPGRRVLALGDHLPPFRARLVERGVYQLPGDTASAQCVGDQGVRDPHAIAFQRVIEDATMALGFQAEATPPCVFDTHRVLPIRSIPRPPTAAPGVSMRATGQLLTSSVRPYLDG